MMRMRLGEVSGIDWFDGAILNARWRGPRLRDVLLKAGLQWDEIPAKSSTANRENMEGQEPDSRHVAFACHVQPCSEEDWYGGSTELWRIMADNSEAVLALEVNIAT
jgi:sulfite oxidase